MFLLDMLHMIACVCTTGGPDYVIRCASISPNLLLTIEGKVQPESTVVVLSTCKSIIADAIAEGITVL
jgi:hypothetical protein